jgi:hypothetical protein
MGAAASAQAQELGISDTCKKFIEVFGLMAGKDATGKAMRTQGWCAVDPNGNGQASLAEVDGWIQKSLITALAPDKEEAIRVWKCFRPSYIRAFNDAKDLGKKGKIKGAKTATKDDYCDKGEFRGLAAYICLYAIMYDAFALIDGGGGDVDNKAGDDRKMTLDEWKAGRSKITNYGFAALKAAADGDAAAKFKEINAGVDGAKDNVVMLIEFCAWIEKEEAKAGTSWGKLLTAGD